jgi:hypothetical protein
MHRKPIMSKMTKGMNYMKPYYKKLTSIWGESGIAEAS